MSKKVQDFVQQVNKQNFSAAKGSFESAMAEKILAVFENKKIELASQMVDDSVVKEGRRKPDLQRDIGWWVVQDDKGYYWSGPFRTRVDAKREKEEDEAALTTLDTTLSVQFGTIDRLGRFLPESHMTEGTQINESRNKPDLQRDIGYWAIEKDTGQIYSGPYEKRKDAKNSAVHLVRGGKRRTPNIVVKFGTVDRTGKFKEL